MTEKTGRKRHLHRLSTFELAQKNPGKHDKKLFRAELRNYIQKQTKNLVCNGYVPICVETYNEDDDPKITWDFGGINSFSRQTHFKNLRSFALGHLIQMDHTHATMRTSKNTTHWWASYAIPLDKIIDRIMGGRKWIDTNRASAFMSVPRPSDQKSA